MPIPSDVFETTTVETAEPSLGTGPIVVATEGGETSNAVLRCTWSLASRSGADVRVVSVVPSVVPVVEFPVVVLVPPNFWQEQRESRLASVREQLQRAIPKECEWPIAVLEGEAGDSIATYAKEQSARLVVMGRGRHALADRLFEPEVVLRVLRFCNVPVLALEASAIALPSRLVVATDFTPYSAYAARVAMAFAAPNATVYFAHVRPPIHSVGPATTQWKRAYAEALPAMFERFRQHVSPAPTHTVEDVTLVGNPGEALVDFATSSHADLIVSGTHGYRFINRLLLGSVATHLLRRSRCSLLCVPGSALTHAASTGAAGGITLDEVSHV